MSIKGKITLDGETVINGDTQISGNLTVDEALSVENGNIKAKKGDVMDGKFKSQTARSMADMRLKYNTHMHSGNLGAPTPLNPPNM